MPCKPLPKRALAPLLVLALVLCLSGTGWAHRPLFPGPRAAAPESAASIADPAKSHVIYAELTAETPHTWFALKNDQPGRSPFRSAYPRNRASRSRNPSWSSSAPGFPSHLASSPWPRPRVRERGP